MKIKRISFNLILLCCISMFTFCSNNKKDDLKVWKETIGTLQKGGKTDRINYKVHDIEYEAIFYWRNYGESGREKYTMRYNINNPEEVKIDYWNPIFEKGEKTIWGIGVIRKVGRRNFFASRGFINFDIYINGLEINRSQTLPPNIDSLFPDLEKDQCYRVECDLEFPRRAILHLEYPASCEIDNLK